MKTTLIIILLLSITIVCFAQANGDYRVRSTVTSGYWNGTAVWQKYTTSWANTTTPPTSANGVITIQSGKEITIGGTGNPSVTADQVVVAGTLIVETDFTLTVAAGAGTDLNVTGTLTVNGTVSAATSATVNVAGTVTFLGGLYPGTISGDGSFTLASGATLETMNSNGITSSGASGSVQTTTRSFSTSANYKYTSGDGVQATGSGLPTPVNNLTISNPHGLSLSSATTITNQLIFTGTGTLYLTDGDLTMGASSTVTGTTRIGFKGTGVLNNLDYVDYLFLFVNDSDAIPATIGTLKLLATPVIPNDFEVNAINFNTSYFDLNYYKVAFTGTDAAFKGDSDVYSLGVSMEETTVYFGSSNSSIPRVWTTYSDEFTNTLELQLTYPEALTDAATVRVWNRPVGDVGNWTLVGTYSTTGTDPRTVAISGLTDLGTSDIPLEWTISTIDQTLPVELSSFSALATPQNFSMLSWTTQSETNVSGYYLFRNTSNDLASAERINAFIQAYNTSQETYYSFTDREVTTGTWFYWLQHIDMNGAFEFHGPVNLTLTGNSGETPIIPMSTSLQNAYPNPFNPNTTVSYGLAKPSAVSLIIYNGKGERIRSLFSGQKSAGIFRVNWDGTSDSGRTVPTGMYFVRMVAGKYSSSIKLILMK